MKNFLSDNNLLPSLTNPSNSSNLQLLHRKEKMKKILFIDDSFDMRMIISTILSSTKWEIICAEDGSVGLKLADKIEPDLIICDINMPELNGYQVLKALRSDTNMASIPFIFLSSESEPESRDLAMELGADHFLRKPVDFDELLQLLENFVFDKNDRH